MGDEDIRKVSEELDRRCGEEASGDEPPCAEDAREALSRIERRLEKADQLHDMLDTRYTLVWPVSGVLMSRKRRKRAIDDYERLRPPEKGD